MVNLKRLLKTPESDWYKGTITRHNHIEILKVIDDALSGIDDGGVQKQRFMDSCFGHFLRMHRTMQFSGTIVHSLLLQEIHHDGSPDEMRFLLGNFGVVPDTTEYLEVENGIHQRCFGGQNEIMFEEVKERVQQGEWTEEFDVVKLCLLLLLHVFLIGADERGSVPIWQVRLVDNLDAFDKFPWGCLVYSYSIYGFKTALSGRRGRSKGKDKHSKEKYNMWGFSYALLIFALEVIPALAREFAIHHNVDPFPRILKWEFTRRPRPDKVKKIIKNRLALLFILFCLCWIKLLIPMNVGGGHWLMASVELTLRSIRLYDPWQQEVQYEIRNQQVACLRYSLPLMLNQIGFYKKRRGKNTTMSPEPFHMVVVSKHNIPQQKTGGNCGAHTLALIEHIVAKRKKFNWTDDQMPQMRQKMAVEVFSNSSIVEDQ
ncbi:hypothetical protein Dsin_007101 [Dipteronia sinensis]|uniref:Ubiquitin-like protease family profile domain-containing protein n=1 Tax=Dipteronia sinensis TaxID=43782 RepID=A0AAE0B184_9ROSI|nr:hypothetical protein Dsin_007101 [Dipteronia sinensis]